MDTRATKRSSQRRRRRPKVTTGTSFGPFQIPGSSGTLIDLTGESPSNNLLPTQLGSSNSGSSNSQPGRSRRNGSVVIFDEVIDLSSTPTKATPPKRSCSEETPIHSPKKQLVFSPCVPSCAICLDKLQFIDPPAEREVMSLQCGHMYCKGCIVPILTDNEHCPKCRRKQRVRDIHPLYA